METLDSLRAERDEARSIVVDLIIGDIVDAYETRDLARLAVHLDLIGRCPYVDRDGLAIGTAVGNFVFYCACIGKARKTEPDEVVLFDVNKVA